MNYQVYLFIWVCITLISCRKTFDTEEKDIPRFVHTNYIELDKIKRISRFRSAMGHDYSDRFESCRSMKHYFEPKDNVDWAAIKIFSPVNGIIYHIRTEEYGKQLRIRCTDYPEFDFIIFHVNMSSSLRLGDRISAGQLLGTHINSKTISDMAVRVHTPKGVKLISYFEVMSDELFQNYQNRGVNSREELIISKEARDADPLTCDGEKFLTYGNMNDWTVLN